MVFRFLWVIVDIVKGNRTFIVALQLCSYAASELIADRLKPLTINQTAMTISCKKIGKLKKNVPPDMDASMRPNAPRKAVAKSSRIAMKPHTEIQRGTRFEVYNIE
jgi:hypothetical protein